MDQLLREGLWAYGLFWLGWICYWAKKIDAQCYSENGLGSKNAFVSFMYMYLSLIGLGLNEKGKRAYRRILFGMIMFVLPAVYVAYLNGNVG